MKNENLDDIFENLDDSFLEQLYDYYDDKFKDTPDPVTPELDAKMSKIFAEARNKQKRKRTKKRALKTVAVIALVMIVSSASILSVDAWRVRIFNMWISFGEDYSSKPTDISPELMEQIPPGTKLPALIKDNFTLSKVVSGPTKIVLIYRNTNNESLIYEVFPSDNTIYGKTSERDDAIEVDVNGWTGYYLSNDATNSLVWNTNDNIFRIAGSISKADLIKMAESVK